MRQAIEIQLDSSLINEDINIGQTLKVGATGNNAQVSKRNTAEYIYLLLVEILLPVIFKQLFTYFMKRFPFLSKLKIQCGMIDA